MNSFSFSYEKTALVPAGELAKLTQQLAPVIAQVSQAAHASDYATPYSSVHLPFDQQLMHVVKTLVAKKKHLNPVCMIVVGIGGSNLGTQAIYEALYCKPGNPEFSLYFADTMDADAMAVLLSHSEKLLQAGKAIMLTVISKSGTTTETIANFECCLALLKKYYPKNYSEYVVAITDENSALWKLAEKNNFDQLAIPAQVGGRYSVFSAVGLFPLACAGIDIEQLRAGARDMMQKCIVQENNPAAISAALIAYHYHQGIAVHDLFLFVTALESVGKWYRQLMGESIGKQTNTHRVGIIPTVSIGSTDLHSVGQLYLAGPTSTFTTFVGVQKTQHTIIVPQFDEYNTLVKGIQGKSLAVIMDAILQGTQHAYEQEKKPFASVILEQINAFTLGQFLQWKMIEIMYLGSLLGVNPFDQPQVELYKTHTRKILSDE